MPARGQRIEIRDAIGREHDHFVVDHEKLWAQLQCGLDDERELLGPIMAAPC